MDPHRGIWHRRDTLLGLFWPEQTPPTRAPRSATPFTYSGRPLGDETLRTRGDEEISIDPSSLETDLAAALREGRPADALGSAVLVLLPPTAMDSALLDNERARPRIEVAQATCRMGGAALEQEGTGVVGIGFSRSIPYDEAGGSPDRRPCTDEDPGGALAAFEEYRARLAREFDAEPTGDDGARG